MRLRWLAKVACATLLLTLLYAPAAVAVCGRDSDLDGAHGECHKSYQEVKAAYARAAAEGYQYQITLACGSDNTGDACSNPRTCINIPGSVLYRVLRAPATTQNWETWGIVCLTATQLDDFQTITTAMVTHQFRTLDWPTAPITIQPPGGRTLVNLPTNAYTTLTNPTTQTITLLGQPVTIEATPVSYTWTWGDGTTETTTTPGAPYTTGEPLQNSHTYTHPTQVNLSVAVTYHGRYRINTTTDWHDIPEELTLPGTPQPLTIIEANPILTG